MKIEYDISDEEMKRAKELIALTRPADIKRGKASASILKGVRSVLSVAALVGGGGFYGAYVFNISGIWNIVALIVLAVMIVGYVFYQALSDYLEARKDVELPSGKKSGIEVLIREISFIDNGVRTRIGRFDVKKFLNVQGFFLLYLDPNEVIVVPPGAFENEQSRIRFKEAVNEIIQGSRVAA